MGNFSRDPQSRLEDSLKKQYVGVRLQQGVPMLDADWNLLEDLRRAELETVGTLFIGSGIPPGSDGFAIFDVPVPQVNDFGIRLGVGLAGGKLARNDANVSYVTQPNFNKPEVTAPLPALTTPAANKNFIVYLDVWEREIDGLKDPTLIDARIGVETAICLKREWVVRVAREPEDLPVLDAPPPGHVFLRLARLKRTATPLITAPMIEDLRDTQLSVQRKIEVRDAGNLIVVDTPRFKNMLEITRNNALAFNRYITTKFNATFSFLTAAEMLGLQTAAHIAHTAEAGLAQANALTLANRGALNFLTQLYQAEQNFMLVWQDVVLQFGGVIKKYASYQTFITQLNQRLNNQNVGPLTGLKPAIDAGNLAAAADMQEEIARLFGAASSSVARGSIQVFLAKSPAGNLTTGQIATFEFRVRSATTQADTFTVNILPQAGWPRAVVDSLGNSLPGNKISVGPNGSETTIFVQTTVQTGSSGLQLRVVSDSNPAEIDQISSLFTLTQGQPAPIGEDKIQLQITNPFQATIGPDGVISFTRNKQGSFEVRVFNNTGQTATFTFKAELVTGNVGTWTVAYTGDATLSLNNGQSKGEGVDVTPAGDAVSAQIRFTATTTIAGSQVSSQIIIPCKAS